MVRSQTPQEENPPSTGSVTPVMKAAASEARKSAPPATSSGTPQRPSGVRPMMVALRPSLPYTGAVMRLVIQPGASALTRMPSSAQAPASDWVSCMIPALLAP